MSPTLPAATKVNDLSTDSITLETAPRQSLWDSIGWNECHTYPAQVQLFNQGDSSVEVYFVRAGLLKLMRTEYDASQLIVDLRFPGSLIGAAAAICGKTHPFSAVTVTSCELSSVSSDHFLELLLAAPLLESHVREALSNEVLDQVSRISEIACLSARRRLENLLWQLCERLHQIEERHLCQSGVKLQLPFKHWEAAQMLSITPSYLSRLFTELELDGVISRRNGWIIVSKPDGLWHVSDSD